MITKEIIIANLKKDGWSESRCIDVSIFDEVFKENGFIWFEAAKKFLESYGLLNLNYYDARQKRINQININPLKVVPNIGESYLYLYEKECKMRLLLVADNIAGIYVAEDWSMWSGYDECFTYLGENLVDYFYRKANNINAKCCVLDEKNYDW